MNLGKESRNEESASKVSASEGCNSPMAQESQDQRELSRENIDNINLDLQSK